MSYILSIVSSTAEAGCCMSGSRWTRHAASVITVDQNGGGNKSRPSIFRHYPNRIELALAERRAIKHEHPIYNIANSTGIEARGAFDIVSCPVCRVESFYRQDMDRYYHLWGDDNLDCWVAISRGEV